MDNESVVIYQSNASCAVLELSRITKEYDKVLYQIASKLYHPSRGAPAAFVMWSDLDLELVKHIENKRWAAGSRPMVSEWRDNPRTGNKVCVVIWPIPHEEFREWYIKQRVNRFKKAMHNPFK